MYFLISKINMNTEQEDVKHKKLVSKTFASVHCDVQIWCVTLCHKHSPICLYENDIPTLSSWRNRSSMMTRIAINDTFLGTMWINRGPGDLKKLCWSPMFSQNKKHLVAFIRNVAACRRFYWCVSARKTSKSSALAMDLRLSCPNPSICI